MQTAPHGPQEINPNADISRITAIGMVANLALAALKFAGGIIGNSHAVVADAVHSLSDMTTDVAILVGVRYWNKPADDSHPHGHRRVETMVTLGIGIVLVVVAFELIRDALTNIQKGHSEPPGMAALVAAFISLITKEFLYRWTLVVGKRVRSSAVIANAWHHRSDALSSLPAGLAVAGALIDPSWGFLDHVGAIAVSLFILQAAVKILRPAFEQLVDAGASGEAVERIRKFAGEVNGVKDVHKIRTRYIGYSTLAVDLHIEVDPTMTVREGHDISELVQRHLEQHCPEVADVVVHLEPFEKESPPR